MSEPKPLFTAEDFLGRAYCACEPPCKKGGDSHVARSLYEFHGIAAALANAKVAPLQAEVERLRAENEELGRQVVGWKTQFLNRTGELSDDNARLREAPKGVIAVADRKTKEFDAARAALKGKSDE